MYRRFSCRFRLVYSNKLKPPSRTVASKYLNKSEIFKLMAVCVVLLQCRVLFDPSSTQNKLSLKKISIWAAQVVCFSLILPFLLYN